jgi:thiol-disulfide isomerase/thioredoxin
MKRILLIALALASSFFVYSQRIVESPKVGSSTLQNVTLNKIELLNSGTVLWFNIRVKPGVEFIIPKKTYIQPVGSNEKLFIISTDGIPLDKKITQPAFCEMQYKLIFPKVDPSVRKLDYGEAIDYGKLFIYNIELRPELFKSVVPDNLHGNWFRNDNAQWEISLYDTMAIYKCQVWQCKQYALNDGIGKIELKNELKTLDVYTKLIDANTCMIGETPASLVKLTNQRIEKSIPADTGIFKLPVFKADTVVFSGFINGFSIRGPVKTGTVYVTDAMTGMQIPHRINIADNGTFNIKFPQLNAQSVLVSLPSVSKQIFFEPGKTTFQLIDLSSKTDPILFMGNSVQINYDLLKLDKIYSFDYDLMKEKILDFTPQQYKTYCHEFQKKDLKKLAIVVEKENICAKAAQIKKMDLDYKYMTNIMEYERNVELAYREKNNVPRDQRSIKLNIPQPDSSFYSFITNEMVNNDLAVISSKYLPFINQLMSLQFLKDKTSFTLSEIADVLKKSGRQLSQEEEELAIQMKEIDNPELKQIQDEFQNKYGDQSMLFYKKYDSKLMELIKAQKGNEITPEIFDAYMMGQGIDVTHDDREFFLAQKELFENPLVKKRTLFYGELRVSIQKFYSNYQYFINKMIAPERVAVKTEKLKSVFGIEPGLATDIMTAQEYYRFIVSEMSPCSAEELKSMQQKISTPFIASYLELKNNETLAKIEANKTQKGANVNEVPKTEGDKVFEAIMAKYKGKVVYVDFWATWCAPCRSGIERIKPLKDEMAGENVAFVYITNQTSPKETYDNMVPGIKGEHFRVSADEWIILCGMFKISGIPHYTLVGKDGKVINPHLSHLENTQLKTLLMKHINE